MKKRTREYLGFRPFITPVFEVSVTYDVDAPLNASSSKKTKHIIVRSRPWQVQEAWNNETFLELLELVFDSAPNLHGPQINDVMEDSTRRAIE